MPNETRVAILRSPRTFAITERPRPVAIESEAVVKIAATAVCHTDLEIYTGNHAGGNLTPFILHQDQERVTVLVL